ncbi:hypothetical protein [Actinomadura macra]|uniref:hypothetical protein n=1 Tax=Actinomadura macra TaxID=46164 RepID=UPI000A9C01E3|nr:hypothetical protein [Actinomadura macra]
MAAALAATAAAAIAGASPSAASPVLATVAPASGVSAPHRLSDVEVVEESGTVSPYEAKIAHCPEGKQPLGGGFDLPYGHTVAASYPIAGTGWLIKARSTTGNPAPFEMTWYAVCATPSPGYKIIKETKTVPNQQGFTLTCSTFKVPYEHMVNVGAEAKGPTAALTGSDMRTNPSSTITYASASGTRSDADTVEIDLYAICTTAYDGSTGWYRQGQSSHANDEGPLWACPADKSSVGVTFTSNASLRSSKPHTISDSDWRITAIHTGANGYNINGGVICAPG